MRKSGLWLYIAAALFSFRPALSLAEIPWNQEVGEYDWRSLRFTDENGKEQTRWFYVTKFDEGEPVALFELTNPQEAPVRESGGKEIHVTSYDSQLDLYYEAVLLKSFDPSDSSRNGPIMKVLKKGLPGDTPADTRIHPSISSWNSVFKKLVHRPKPGTEEKPRLTPMPGFRTVPEIRNMHLYIFEADDRTSTRDRIHLMFLPFEIEVAQGLLLERNIFPRPEDDKGFAKVLKDVNEGREAPEDYVKPRRQEIRAAVDNIKNLQTPDEFHFSEFEFDFLIGRFAWMNASDPQVPGHRDQKFYEDLNKAIDDSSDDNGNAPLRGFVSRWRTFVRNELEIYLKESETRPSGTSVKEDYDYYYDSLHQIYVRTEAALDGEDLGAIPETGMGLSERKIEPTKGEELRERMDEVSRALEGED